MTRTFFPCAWPARRILLAIGFCISLGFLTGCGTVTPIKPAAEAQAVDLKHYNRVIVKAFEDGVSMKAKDPEVQARRRNGVGKFRDMILTELRGGGAFKEVLPEGTPDADTLTIGGAVTRYVEGSAAARLLVGLGAGNAYFDATVEVRDGLSGKLLGTLTVDRNSWGGGGLLSMSQTLDSFMQEAVKRLGAQLTLAKEQGKFGVPAPAKK